jgi:hypothetical protein
LVTVLEFSLSNTQIAIQFEWFQAAFESPTVMPEPSPLPPVKRFVAKPPGTIILRFIGGPWNGREETPSSLRDRSRLSTAVGLLSTLGRAEADMPLSLPYRSGSFTPPERISVTVGRNTVRMAGDIADIVDATTGYYKLQLSATTDDVYVYDWQDTTPPRVPSHPKGLRLRTQRLDRRRSRGKG